jgi:cyclase
MRIIPTLLLCNSGLSKTKKFLKPQYVGDPINTVRIFNDKEVDELILLDICATKEAREPDIDIIRDIASECFMPLSYGGGLTNLELIREVLSAGVEKVVLNTAAVKQKKLIAEASNYFGSSTVVVSIDARKKFFGGYEVCINGGREKTGLDPIEWAKECEGLGAGEIVINSIDQDGMMQGYDWQLIRNVSEAVSLPVIAAGGAGSLADLVRAIKECKVSAVAAGSLFVFHGKYRAVLITYPNAADLATALNVS